MYELLHHTADVRVRVFAPDLRTLFEDALRGMFEILEPSVSADAVERSIRVESADLTALLVDFLNEALSLALTRRECYDRIERFDADLEMHAVSAVLIGHRVAGFGDDVKAVTYHEAELVHGESGWETMLVFDL